MGLFKSKIAVWNPAAPAKVEELELLVDTGASYSWFLRKRLEELGIRSTGKMQFRTIDGRVIERDVAPVFVRSDGHVGGDTIVVAESGDSEVFGGAHPGIIRARRRPSAKEIDSDGRVGFRGRDADLR